MRALIPATLILNAALAFSAPAPAQTRYDPDAINRALSAVASSEWAEAESHARQTGRAVAEDIVLWSRLRSGLGTWDEYTDFLERNSDWPGLATLRRAGEWLMPPDLPPHEVGKYFRAGLPQTGIGSVRLADAFVATGRLSAAERTISRAWLELPMSAPEKNAIMSEYGAQVAGREVERLDMLLWNGYMTEAETMLGEVDADWQALARARIATRRDTPGLQLLIDGLPASVRDDPGLSFERYLYRIDKGRWDDAEDYLYEKTASRETLGRPEMWMERRAGLARQALRRGAVERAYRLAASNFGSEGADYAEAEWLAGFIALTEMNDFSRRRTFHPLSQRCLDADQRRPSGLLARARARTVRQARRGGGGLSARGGAPDQLLRPARRGTGGASH